MLAAQGTAIPQHLTTFGPHWFLAELVFVLLLLAGIVTLWSWMRERLLGGEERFWALAPEAVIAVPWLLFPILFGAALLGGFRPVLVAAQVGFVIAGAMGLWAHRRSAPAALRGVVGMARESWINAMALAAVGLFLLWGWLMPFPESYNGHHHLLMNLISEMWRSGGYPVLPDASVSYDTGIFVWPASLAFFLALFSLPGLDAVDTRSVFLLPGLFALMTLQLLRLTTAQLGARKTVGSMAFFLACFGYFTASEFTDISFDLFSPLVLSYFGLHVARWVLAGERNWFPILLVLAFTFLVRRQVFLLLAAVTIALVFARLVRWPDVRRALTPLSRTGAGLVLAGVMLPVFVWSAFVTIQYGNPLFPFESRIASFGLFHLDELLNSQIGPHPALLIQFFPLFPDEGLPRMVKNAFAGLSFSILLSLAVVGFLLAASRLANPQDGLLLRRVALAMLAGFAVIFYVAFADYPKFPHYAVYLLAPFGALFLVWLAQGSWGRIVVPLVIGAVFATGVGFWAYNGWGHSSGDASLVNAKFLVPSYGEPLDRLVRRANRSAESLSAEMTEYGQAFASLGPGEHILHMEHEPGALIPSLLDREFLGDALYLQSERTQDILDARSDSELRQTLRRLRVRYVYRPGRPHYGVDETLIMRRIRAYGGNRQFLIPVKDLLGRGTE